jgi:hypothetical protein
MVQVTQSQQLEYLDKTFFKESIDNSKLLKEKEFLKYDIKVGLFSVGIINFKKFFQKDSEIIIVDVKGYTKGLAKLFFNLNVNYKSFFLEKEFLTLKLIKLINEDGNKKREEILFNNRLKKVYYQDKKNEEGEFFFYENKLFDLVSGIYFFRSNINIFYNGSSLFNIPYIHNGEGIKNLKIKLVGNDKISISDVYYRSKKFLCVFESTNKLFEKRSEVYFWISDDQFKLPLRIETKTRISKIKIELKNVSDYIK